MLRRPAVAGRFYPAKPDELAKAIEGYVRPIENRVQVIGVMVPHAGYIYSAHVAGDVYSHVNLPSRNVMLGPNHTGFGTPLSIMRSGAWLTPLGEMQIDQELCESLMAADPDLENDAEAHRFEHALEVQLPFLQRALVDVLLPDASHGLGLLRTHHDRHRRLATAGSAGPSNRRCASEGR